MKAPECPVFRPTAQDVHSLSFVEYVSKLELQPAFREAGICRIVAPDSWAPRLQGYNRLHLELPRPIRQHATGRQGLFRTLLVESPKMTLSDFRDMANDPLNAAPKGASAEDLERKFWSNVTLNPPLYGADVPGSLFDERVKGWSLRRLRSLLSDTLEQHGIQMPGVNEPYLYIGSWRSVFAWHTEDMDLHSVNYLHCGASKQWYVIPPAHRQRFELLMRSLLQDLFRACPEFMRHKELLVSPQLLASHAIPVVRVVHNPREFVVVYPGAYHSGFNHGFNIAESVNFATKAWLPIGVAANFCECQPDSARIDMRLFLQHMPAKLRRQVEHMYASSDEEEDSGDDSSAAEESDCECCSSAEEEEEEEEEEVASGSDGEEETSGDEDTPPKRQRQQQQQGQQRRRPPRQRQPRQRRRRPAASAAAEEDGDEESRADSSAGWEAEAQKRAQRARGIPAQVLSAPAAPAAAATPPPQEAAGVPPAAAAAVGGSKRPQRNRRPPRRDLDMTPLRVRPPTLPASASNHTAPAGAAVAAAAGGAKQRQKQQQHQGGGSKLGGVAGRLGRGTEREREGGGSSSRKRSRSHSSPDKPPRPAAAPLAAVPPAAVQAVPSPPAAAAGGDAVVVSAKKFVGTSSRGRPLLLKVMDSAAALLPFSYRRMAHGNG